MTMTITMATKTTSDYSWRRSGTCGCEVLDRDGAVVAWTVDDLWAATIAHSLHGMSSMDNADLGDVVPVLPGRIESCETAAMSTGAPLGRRAEG